MVKSGAGNALNADARFVNAGLVEVQEGIYQPPTRDPLAGATDTGTYTVDAGAELRFAGGRTIDAGASISGQGTLRQSSSTATIDGSLEVGDLIVAGGTLLLNDAATLDTLTITAGTLTAESDLTVPTVTQSAGTLNGSATLETSDFTWSGGNQGSPDAAPPANQSLIGTTAIASAGSMTITNAPSLHADREIVNDGRVVQTGDLNLAGFITSNGPWTALDATFNRDENNAAATFNNHDTLTFTGDGGRSRAQMANGDDGTIVVPSGDIEFERLTNLTGTRVLSHGTFVLTGTLRVDDADIRTIAESATLIMRGPDARFLGRFGQDGLRNLGTNDGILRFDDGAEIDTNVDLSNGPSGLIGGSGTVVLPDGGSLANEGTIAPGESPGTFGVSRESPGTLSVEGDFFQDAGGRLEIEIGRPAAGGDQFAATSLAAGGDQLAATGPVAGDDYDQLAVSGAATLDGTLSLATIDGYEPDGDYQAVTYAQHSGQFATIEDPSSTYGVTYNATDVTVAPGLTAPDTTIDSQPRESDARMRSRDVRVQLRRPVLELRVQASTARRSRPAARRPASLLCATASTPSRCVRSGRRGTPTPTPAIPTRGRSTQRRRRRRSTPAARSEQSRREASSSARTSLGPRSSASSIPTRSRPAPRRSSSRATSATASLTEGQGTERSRAHRSDAGQRSAGLSTPSLRRRSTRTLPTRPASADSTFEFSSDQAGSSFECKLNGAPFEACTSPVTFSALGDGEHNFQVRAIGPAGNPDPTPDTFTWTIDTTVHQLTVQSSGGGTVSSEPAAISCGDGGSCEGDFANGTEVVLTAVSDSGPAETNVDWNGCDSIDHNECTVTVDDDSTVTVAFLRTPRGVRGGGRQGRLGDRRAWLPRPRLLLRADRARDRGRPHRDPRSRLHLARLALL